MDNNYVSVLVYVCKYIYLDSYTVYREKSCGSPLLYFVLFNCGVRPTDTDRNPLSSRVNRNMISVLKVGTRGAL
jgi:hypothetical protein